MANGERQSVKQDAMIDRVFNEKFKAVSLIARGGMGAVYRAEQAPLGRLCALKVLRPQLEDEARFEFQKRFFLEASIASKLTHPNTVTIFDYGRTEDGVYFMAMEYLEGRTLFSTIKGEAPFDEPRALHIAKQVSRALREAHAMGVIHRDIKPANIYLIEHGDESDFVKVLDFGLVKDVEADEELTQAGLFMGSPKYMSPEQIRGDKVDARTDIYSLGAVLFEMVTGKPPYDRGPSVNTLMAHLNDPVPTLASFGVEASPAMEALVARCLAKDPDQRFASMEELLSAMKRTDGSPLNATMEMPAYSSTGPSGALSTGGAQVLGPRTSSGPSAIPSIPPASPAPPRRSPVLVAAAALIAVAALVGFFLRPPPAPAPTPAAAPPPVTAANDVPTTPVAAPLPVPPPREDVMMHVTSDPNGASVHLGSKDGRELCASTPCDVKLAPDQKVELTFVKRGFANVTKELTVVSGDVTQKLRPATGGGGGVAPNATIYKKDPYGAGLPPY